MEKRKLGRTGHMSTVAIFGGAAFSDSTPKKAEKAMQQLFDYGVNHIDVAPSYGKAEETLAPLIKGHRERFFLGCKTTERMYADANVELYRSLERLGVDYFDLYQLHAVSSLEILDQATQPGGALDAIIAARQEGLVHNIGITAHGNQAPVVLIEALQRFPFDTVMFPINPVQFANSIYHEKSEEVFTKCTQQDVGIMVIKSIAKKPWSNEGENPYDTWYEPYDEPGLIQNAVNFVLSYPVTGICTAGDVNLLPIVLDACAHYSVINIDQQNDMISHANPENTIYVSTNF